MTRVAIHIDRLVLDGFRHGDRHAVAAGLEQELARVLGKRQTVARLAVLGNVPTLDAGRVSIAPGAAPHRVGQQVARGIGRGISK